MGVKKQTGNHHVSQRNDNFLKEFDRVWAGAFSFSPPSTAGWGWAGVIREEKEGGGKARQ